MLKKTIILAAIIFCGSQLFADTPGKAKMHDSKISFQGVKDIAGYTFYWVLENGDKPDIITTDTSFFMMSSGGAPYSYFFWGVNTSTKKSTDTVRFYNYYSPDYVIILNAVKNDSVYYTQKELSNANDIVNEGNTDSIANKQLVADAKAAKQKHYVKIGLFTAAGLAALGGLVWYFLRRRKKKAIVQITA
jgi:LPXTG-motif cell wall-anchored protein